jgi:DNA-nicking Smr family endonuclease
MTNAPATTTNGAAPTPTPATTATTQEKPKPNPAEVKTAVAEYVVADDEYAKALAHAESKKHARDAVAKTIHDRFGKGKYLVRGEVLLLTARKSKKEGLPESYFFRGKSDDGVIGGD